MSKRSIVVAALALLLGGAGCQTSHVEKHWGEAYATAIQRQTADPDGSRANADAPGPEGLDGASAASAMRKYREVDNKVETSSGSSPVRAMSSGK